MGTNTSRDITVSIVEPSTISWNRERSSEELQAFISRHFENMDLSDE